MQQIFSGSLTKRIRGEIMDMRAMIILISILIIFTITQCGKAQQRSREIMEQYIANENHWRIQYENKL